MPSDLPPVPSRLLNDVREILRQARDQIYTAANAAMVDAYWRIGRRIVEEEQGGAARAVYGGQLIRHLAKALGEEFGSGMSVANLKNFRQFYLTFPDAGKSYAVRSQLSWTHWRLIMRVEDPKARDYYIEETARQQWSVRMFDDLKRGEDDNPTLGIILCADKDETLVHYSVLSESQQLFASKYRLILPSEEELQAELERRHIFDWPKEGTENL